ncbi:MULTISPECIES: YbaB/EbfC family nucleoid-associated protein [Gordonia]|nr:YbaB/EbfC family nucleoid-associated protein [Gordonia jacobaea]
MRDRWTRMLDDVDHQRVELARVAGELDRLTAQASTPDRLVSVTVGSRGLVRDVDIRPAALRHYRADQLAATIVELVARADSELRDQRERLLHTVSELRPDYSDVRRNGDEVPAGRDRAPR